MSTIRVQFVPGFKGETVVLLTMDGSGLAAFKSAIAEIIQKGLGFAAQLVTDGALHVFLAKEGKADIEIQTDRIIWNLSPSKLVEIYEKLESMTWSIVPCHHYVDIVSPAETLVLSRDQYI